MQNAQMLRIQIFDMLSFLPLESLKAIAKFTSSLYQVNRVDDMYDQNTHFDVIQSQNPSVRGPRLANPEQIIYFKKEMEILDEDSQV